MLFCVIIGIPDYRSEEVGLYARTNHKPIQYQEFVKYPKVRQRYWARNFIGWPRFSAVQPNVAHRAIRDLEKVLVLILIYHELYYIIICVSFAVTSDMI